MSTTEAPVVESTRVVDGTSVPAAGSWTVDKSHSSVEFVVRHLMVAKVRGRFNDYDAQIDSLSTQLQLSTKPGSSIDVWGGCIKVTTIDDGRAVNSFYDPDSLKLVATL